MKDEKILVDNGRDQMARFESDIQTTIDRCQALLDTFHLFQDLKTITTEEEFVELIKDPEGYFDNVIVSSVKLDIVGRAKVVPSALAPLVGIDREGWLNIVAGQPVNEGCKPCGKSRIKKGQTAISYQDYLHDKQYICFSDGAFFQNIQELDKKRESYRLYVTNDKQKEVYLHWHSFCDILNAHREKGYCLEQETQSFAQKAGLRYSYATNKFHVDEKLLTAEILKLK